LLHLYTTASIALVEAAMQVQLSLSFSCRILLSTRAWVGCCPSVLLSSTAAVTVAEHFSDAGAVHDTGSRHSWTICCRGCQPGAAGSICYHALCIVASALYHATELSAA